MENWQKQFVRCLFPYSSSRLQVERAFTLKHPHVPPFLYKYREFNDPHLDALKRGVLYMSSPDRFNDPFDSTVHFDTSRFIVENRSIGEILEDVEKQLQHGESRSTPQRTPFKNPIRQDEHSRRMTREILKDESEEVRGVIAQFREEQSRAVSKELSENLSTWFRKGFSVLSLSADPTSILMWSHYARAHTGFCIEYDFSSLHYSDLRRRLCSPVFYRGKRTDATRYLADTSGTTFNPLFGEYLCLLKDAAWSYEREWRIIFAIAPEVANRELAMPKPSAIIAGSAASPENTKALQGYCEQVGIAFKQAVHDNARTGITIEQPPRMEA